MGSLKLSYQLLKKYLHIYITVRISTLKVLEGINTFVVLFR